MESVIQKRLSEIEAEHSVKILFAVESGSRAWGLESTDSDYDVRFIYVHQKYWYLSLDQKRDVIEYPVDDLLDFSGWDVKKALQLFSKSNPTFLEWIKSPILYRESGNFLQNIQKIESQYFSPKSCLHHYLNMATSNYRSYLMGETVRAKKYFYVLRPLLCCEWIDKKCTPPPMEFETLLQESEISSGLINEIEQLLIRKKQGQELQKESSIPALNQYMNEQIELYQQLVSSLSSDYISIEPLNTLFREIVSEQ